MTKPALGFVGEPSDQPVSLVAQRKSIAGVHDPDEIVDLTVARRIVRFEMADSKPARIELSTNAGRHSVAARVAHIGPDQQSIARLTARRLARLLDLEVQRRERCDRPVASTLGETCDNWPPVFREFPIGKRLLERVHRCIQADAPVLPRPFS